MPKFSLNSSRSSAKRSANVEAMKFGSVTARVPPSNIVGREQLEVRRRPYTEANLDEQLPTYGSDLAVGARLTAEAVVDAGHWRRKRRNHSRRQHNQNTAAALTVLASELR